MKNLKLNEEFKINIRSKITYLGDIIRDNYMHPDAKLASKEYKEIINMGINIIPFLIEDLRNKKYYSKTFLSYYYIFLCAKVSLDSEKAQRDARNMVITIGNTLPPKNGLMAAITIAPVTICRVPPRAEAMPAIGP